MNKISDIELQEINGGGISWGIAVGIVAAVTFIVGVIDGYTNPLKCHN